MVYVPCGNSYIVPVNVEAELEIVTVLEATGETDDSLVEVGVLDTAVLAADVEDDVGAEELEAGGVEEAGEGSCELEGGGVVEAGGVVAAGGSDVVDGGGGGLVEGSGVVVGEVLGSVSELGVGLSLVVLPRSLVTVTTTKLITEDMADCCRLASVVRIRRCPAVVDSGDTSEMDIYKRIRAWQQKSSVHSTATNMRAGARLSRPPCRNKPATHGIACPIKPAT